MIDTYQLAIEHFQKRDYKSSEDILLKLKEDNENNADVLYFLAVVKSKLKDFESAIPLFEEVVKIKEEHTEAYYNLALCLQNLNKDEEALKNYKKVIELNPFLSEAHNNIAIIYKNMSKYDEAEKAFRMAVKVKPDNSNAMSNLANLPIDKEQSKEYQEAFELYEKKEFAAAKDIIISLLNKAPDSIHLLTSLGIIYFNLNNFEKSIECYKKIIELNDKNAEAQYSLGVCYQNLDNNELALKYYKKAIELNPAYLDAHNNLGLLYSSLKNYSEAEKCFNKALKYNPGYFNSIINLGAIKLHEDDFDAALDYFNRALEISINKKNDPRKSVAYSNIGFVSLRRKNLKEAIKYFNKGIELDPESVLAHYNKAEALLMLGRFEEGWKEYEWRQGRKDFGNRKFDKTFKPEYDLKGKKILVYAEQGLGDAIQFIRYLPMLKEKGCYIILECGKELHKLLYNFNSVDEIIERNFTEKPNIEYDYDVPLLSLPLYFKTDAASIPAKIPYLNVKKELKERWAAFINDSEKIKIGIVWAGSPIHTNDRHRSVRLQQFLSLFSIEGTHFYSLQKGFQIVQAYDYQLLITNLDEHIKSFEDTSAIIENLDLVITVDTSVAHLAGALGKTTWVLLPYLSDWRWLTNGEKSAWYPSIKLYRQPKISDWDSVFKELKKDLIDLVKNKNGKIVKKINNSFNSFENLICELSNRNNNRVNFTYEIDNNILKKIILKENDNILYLGNTGDYKNKFPNQNVEIVNPLITHEKYYFESKTKKYDLIISNNTLQYNIAPFHTLQEFKKILMPRGFLVVIIPSSNISKELINKSDINSLFPIHLWNSLLKRTGFEVIDNNNNDADYYTFICSNKETKSETLYLGLTSGENFGWGVCSKYLKRELSNKTNIINIDEHEELVKTEKVNGTVFHALNNRDFRGLHPVRGTKNIGYTFFEYELNEAAVKNAASYNIILGGSSWNQEKLNEKGIENAGVIIQGVDPELFYPGEKEKSNDLFIIFSGGKFELRKGQDLVLKAIGVLQQKFSDIILLNAWYNMWPNTMHSMEVSRHINYEYKGETWKNFMINLCKINNIDGNKVFSLPITPGNKLRDLYLNSDVGLFPNRCEGGTNLVLMEYMACGKPVIASYNSGHKDILTPDNSLMLNEMHEFKLFDDNNKLMADWEEPDFDEIISKLEYAYYNRDTIKQIGHKAGQDMKNYTWEKSAESLLEILNKI